MDVEVRGITEDDQEDDGEHDHHRHGPAVAPQLAELLGNHRPHRALLSTGGQLTQHSMKSTTVDFFVSSRCRMGPVTVFALLSRGFLTCDDAEVKFAAVRNQLDAD